ncbi:MAG: hypothetical protein FJ137_08750 [Deltaproteobacteria bacterium]|nr:hypothetical protein [Deltaproteobacteria bacterium]
MEDLLRLATLFLLFLALFTGTCCIVFALVVRFERRQQAAFLATFYGDPHFQASLGDWRTPIAVYSRGLDPGGRILALGGGKNEPLRWEAFSAAPRTAARTTLSVTPEGAVGRLREWLGFTDIHTGDDAFDRAFCVRGNDADVVRGVFLAPSVRVAVQDLFALGGVKSFSIDARGAVHVRAWRRDLAGPLARELLRRTLAVTAALEAHADARPALPPSMTAALTEGAGGDSGAPVAVPIVVVDPHRR